MVAQKKTEFKKNNGNRNVKFEAAEYILREIKFNTKLKFGISHLMLHITVLNLKLPNPMM